MTNARTTTGLWGKTQAIVRGLATALPFQNIPPAQDKDTNSNVTTSQYGAFQEAYDYFNRTLWDSQLPACLITLQRQSRFLGYFRHNSFVSRDGTRKTDEIALNPDYFVGASDKDILSTLVHEMAHLWQFHMGKPGLNGYHNKQWGTEMDRIGLPPSHNAAPGGKRTGRRMSHYIAVGEAYDRAADAFLADRTVVDWTSNPTLVPRRSVIRRNRRY